MSGVKHEEALSSKPKHNFNIYAPYKTEEVHQYLMTSNDSKEYDQNIQAIMHQIDKIKAIDAKVLERE